MKAPFPWFGGKSRVADLVWDRFGNVANYVEPFAGSLAVLLSRPHAPGIETVNDLDCMIANFWRALQHDPDEVSYWADNPVNEADQHARHLWLVSQEEFRERMKVDPEFYDVKIAGWWVWGQCIWIGSGWCAKQLPEFGDDGSSRPSRKIPHLRNAGHGVNRQLPHRPIPHLSDAGTGVHRKLPHIGGGGRGINRQLPHLGGGRGVNRQIPRLGDAGTGVHRQILQPIEGDDPLLCYMNELAGRLRKVRVCCGDWSRVCGPSPTFRLGTTGVFLDPPYSDAAGGRTENVYASDSTTVSPEVRQWAIENAENPDMRIALCGYEGEHDMPGSWECVGWKAHGGYGSQSDGRGRENSERERIWFSKYCLKPSSLFADLEFAS